MKETRLAGRLLKWHTKNPRPLPWKGTRDAYVIWLSEIILQQTRVDQGTPYFLRMLEKFPDVHALASATEKQVMRQWQGLGYYSRARNLHATAKMVVKKFNGKFPNDFNALKSLPGIGDYTAAAIASFAFNLPHAVVDGNVQRVLARLFGIEDEVNSVAGKKNFAAVAQENLSLKDPAGYNQAIMNFGALVCTPASPRCMDCPLNDFCFAFAKHRIADFPRKKKKAIKTIRHFNFLVIEKNKKLLIEQRTGKDIWQNLYQLPLIETKRPVKNEKDERLIREAQKLLLLNIRKLRPVGLPVVQLLSHQKIIARFWLAAESPKKKSSFRFVSFKSLNKFAFPKIIFEFLKKHYL